MAIGDRVRINGGMKEFVGKIGVVVTKEHDRLWRVRLDEPCEVSGVGHVTDDLWEGRYLTKVRSRTINVGHVAAWEWS